MEIKTALILCAGLGKRLEPITLKTPKPLIELNHITVAKPRNARFGHLNGPKFGFFSWIFGNFYTAALWRVFLARCEARALRMQISVRGIEEEEEEGDKGPKDF